MLKISLSFAIIKIKKFRCFRVIIFNKEGKGIVNPELLITIYYYNDYQ